MTQEQKWLAYVGELRVKHETEMKIIAVGFVEYIRDRAAINLNMNNDIMDIAVAQLKIHNKNIKHLLRL